MSVGYSLSVGLELDGSDWGSYPLLTIKLQVFFVMCFDPSPKNSFTRWTAGLSAAQSRSVRKGAGFAFVVAALGITSGYDTWGTWGGRTSGALGYGSGRTLDASGSCNKGTWGNSGCQVLGTWGGGT